MSSYWIITTKDDKRFQDICKEIIFWKNRVFIYPSKVWNQENKDRVKIEVGFNQLVSIDIYILIIENICFDFLRTSYQEKIYKEMFWKQMRGIFERSFLLSI